MCTRTDGRVQQAMKSLCARLESFLFLSISLCIVKVHFNGPMSLDHLMLLVKMILSLSLFVGKFLRYDAFRYILVNCAQTFVELRVAARRNYYR